MVKEAFYTVIETQVATDGTKSVVPVVIDDWDNALSRYYTILASAAISTIPYHAACIIGDDGIMKEGRVFDRRVEPSPEPENA